MCKLAYHDVLYLVTQQSFSSEEATGMTCVKSCQKPPLFLTEKISTSSNTDLQLAKSDYISDIGRISVKAKIYLRFKKNSTHQYLRKK